MKTYKIKLFIVSILLLNFILLLPNNSFSKNKDKANSKRKTKEQSNTQSELVDVVYFNDGSSFRGILDTTTSKITSSNGTIRTYNKANISTITKEPIFNYKNILKQHKVPIAIRPTGIAEVSYLLSPSLAHIIGTSVSYGAKFGRFFYLGFGVGLHNTFQWDNRDHYFLISANGSTYPLDMNINEVQIPLFMHIRFVGDKNFVSPFFDCKIGGMPIIEVATLRDKYFNIRESASFTYGSWYVSCAVGASIKMPYNPQHSISIGAVISSNLIQEVEKFISLGVSIGYSF